MIESDDSPKNGKVREETSRKITSSMASDPKARKVTMNELRRYLDAGAWDHIARVASVVPNDLNPGRFQLDASLINEFEERELGRALQYLLRAMCEYDTDMLMGVIRTCCGHPVAPPLPSQEASKAEEEEWDGLFEVPWEGRR